MANDGNSELGALRRAVLKDPRNGELRYLLAAQMAQLRDYDGAVLEFSAAIALNPHLHVARLQLGLLHMTLAQPSHVTVVLAPLEELADSSALKHFKRGIEALLVDDFSGCLRHLQQGMDLNRDNVPLNRDMAMIKERVQSALDAQQIAATQLKQEPASADAVRTDFSLYGLTKH